MCARGFAANGKPPHSQCVGQSRAKLVRTESSVPEPVFFEQAPRKEKISRHTKLASKKEIKQALSESTRTVVLPDGWKRCLRHKDKNELYNLRDDPDERRNLYYGNDHHDVIAQLTAEIHRWQRRTNDTVKV